MAKYKITFWKSIEVFSIRQQYIYCVFETFLKSTCEKKRSAEIGLIHTEQTSLYNLITLRKTVDTAED